MRSDREMLELAAKAAGLEVWPGTGFQAHLLFRRPHMPDPSGKVSGVEWNPLTDDGDALQLASSLRFHILHNDPGEPVLWVSAVLNKRGMHEVVEFQEESRRIAATRRAIVRAAAEIGAKMQEGL